MMDSSGQQVAGKHCSTPHTNYFNFIYRTNKPGSFAQTVHTMSQLALSDGLTIKQLQYYFAAVRQTCRPPWSTQAGVMVYVVLGHSQSTLVSVVHWHCQNTLVSVALLHCQSTMILTISMKTSSSKQPKTKQPNHERTKQPYNQTTK